MSRARQGLGPFAPKWRSVWLAKLCLAGALASTACALGAPREPLKQEPKPKVAAGRPESQLGALPMARVPSGTFGPHMAMTAGGPFVAWAEPAADGVVWRTMAPGTKTRLRLGPSLPKTPGMLSFFKLDRARNGAVLARVTRKGRIDAIATTLLQATGASAAQELSAEEGEVLWVASVPSAPSARVLWARRRGASAEIGTAVLDALGMVSSREILRQGAIGWQVAEGPAGTWLATLEGTTQKATLVLTKLDVSSPRGQAFEVAKDLKGADQLDLWVGESVVVTLRDEVEHLTRLRMAELDRAGVVSVPLRSITAPRGDQSLFKLLPTSGPTRPWLAWEEPALDGPSWRRVLLARLSQDGVQAPEAWLDVHDATSLLPGLADADGTIVALTREPVCADGESDCAASRSGLTLSGLGGMGQGRSRVTSVAGLPEGLPPGSLCWDLDCLGSSCGVLCAEADTPTSIHFAAFDTADVAKQHGAGSGAQLSTAGGLRDLARGPRMVGLEHVAAVSAVSDVAFGRSDTETLLSWVTDFDPSTELKPLDRPAPDGRREPYQADVRILALSPPTGLGTSQSKADTIRVLQDTVISHRARSLGGVSLSGERGGRRALGWAALDQGRAHVFATLLDARGKKLKQRLLSRKSGEVTDVQVVTTKSGFLFFWVDDRSGHGQVHAQAVDGELNSVGPERLLTPDTKDPIGLAALARGEQVVLTFADGQGDGRGSIFAMSVLASNLDTVVAPRALTTGDGHAHSPVLYVDPKDGLCVMFVEGRTGGDSLAATDLRTMALDVGLRPASATVVLPAVDVRTFGIDCGASGCRVVAVSSDVQRAEIWGAASVDGVTWRSQFLLGLDGEAELVPPPVVLGNEAYVVGPSGNDGFAVERLVIDFAEGASSR